MLAWLTKSIGSASMVSNWNHNGRKYRRWGLGLESSSESKANSRHITLLPKIFYFLFNWGSKTFPLFRVQNVLRQDNELGRVYGWDNSLALMPYRMWLCVGHAQQHLVLSMQKESPTTAEKVWKWYCLHCLTCLTNYTSCTILYSWYSAYLMDFRDTWLKREKSLIHFDLLLVVMLTLHIVE